MDTPEDMTVEAYARLAVDLHRVPEAQWDEVAARHGVGPGAVAELGRRFEERFAANPALAIEYNAHYQRAMLDAGITAPEVSLEQYADLVRSGPTPETLERYGIDTQQFSMIMQRMGERMMSDPSLARRFAQLMMPGAG